MIALAFANFFQDFFDQTRGVVVINYMGLDCFFGGLKNVRNFVGGAAGFAQYSDYFLIFKGNGEFIKRTHASANSDDCVGATGQKQVTAGIAKSGINYD